jgi:hypothetical protein
VARSYRLWLLLGVAVLIVALGAVVPALALPDRDVSACMTQPCDPVIVHTDHDAIRAAILFVCLILAITLSVVALRRYHTRPTLEPPDPG